MLYEIFSLLEKLNREEYATHIMALNLEHLHRVHCVGVGGIGVSAVAKLFRLQGKEVTGSDRSRSEVTDDAEKAGVVVLDEDAENILPELDLLIYTSAAPEDHPERKAAVALGIPQFSYFECLGLLSEGYRTIAVAGTNGKSTTTAMLGLILEEAGLDPTVIVGSRVSKFPYGNLRIGKSDIFVVEACEHEAQLMHLSPYMAVMTNIAEDHLDFYKDLDHIKSMFREFAEKLPKDGLLIVNADDKNSSGLAADCETTRFGIEVGDYRAIKRHAGEGAQHFSIELGGGDVVWEDMTLGVPGKFNLENALAAATAAHQLGASEEAIRTTLRQYAGIWRRFERLGVCDGSAVISDYGHHPEAVAGTLDAAREFYPDKKIVLAFQPHHHNRTEKLYDGFVEALRGADALVIQEIYAVTGRSEEGGVSSHDLVKSVKEKGLQDVWYAEDVKAVSAQLRKLASKDTVLIVMGAGEIYKAAHELVS